MINKSNTSADETIDDEENLAELKIKQALPNLYALYEKKEIPSIFCWRT
jgi:hypothetical protein